MEKTGTAAPAADAGSTTNLETFLEKPTPKGEGGAPAADDKSTAADDASDSPTSSSSTDEDLSPDEIIEKAAKAERAFTLKQKELDKAIKDANEKAGVAEKTKQEYDAKLAKAARLMLADESLSKGEKLKALKEFAGDSWNPAEFMELVATDPHFAAAGGEGAEGDKKDERPLAEQVNDLIEAREKKKAEEQAEARKTAEAKQKEEDEKKAAAERTERIERYKDEAVASVSAEATPLLKARLDRWVDELGEKKAKELMREQVIDTFRDVLIDHKKALDPDEVVQLLELKLKKKQAPPRRTPMEMVEAEAEEIDEEVRKEERRTSVVHRADVPAPKKKSRDEMTALERVMAEADEADRRAYRGRANEAD